MREVEVVLSMPLFHHRLVRKNSIVVVVDILRTGTSILAALDHGVKSIIPVSSAGEAEVMKDDGYLLAAEENGEILKIADIGISAQYFWNDDFIGKEIVFKSANGTKAFRLTREESDKVIIGAFPNLTAISEYLGKQQKNIVIVCAGTNNMPALEDQIFAGALSKKLQKANFIINCDSAKASIDIWEAAEKDIFEYAKKLSHRTSLPNVLNNKALNYTFSIDTTQTIPVLHFNHITAL